MLAQAALGAEPQLLAVLLQSRNGRRFDELATRFKMAYEAQAKEYSVARVRLYEAITYLKLAHIIACITPPRTPPRGWQQSVATLLQEAQKTV